MPIPLIYMDAFPGVDELEFTSKGHLFTVKAVKERGIHTGRQRYYIECKTCDQVLHHATTGPREWALQHIEEATP